MPGKGGKEPDMAEEATATEQEQAEQAEQKVDTTTEATDWQAKYEAARAHSREWEKKAKANKEAADELEKLKAEQMTEQEKAVKRAEKAEAELQALKAKAERAETVASVADKANVPAEVVGMLSGKDADELTAQIARLMKLLPAYPTRTDDGGHNKAAVTPPREIPQIF
jgi:chromosome segregation ATPase